MLNPESNRLEYKRELDTSNKLERAVVSFLNYNGGGEIIIGIDDDGLVHGVSDPDGDQLKIVDRLANNIRPKIQGLFDVIVEQIDGKYVIRVLVSSGAQQPYFLRNKGMTEDGCFIRVGASAQPMTEAMIERLITTRQTNTLSSMPSPRQKLTFEQLQIYYSEHGLKLNTQFEDNLDLRLTDGSYSFLAYLLADNNGASIKVAKYAGTNKIDLVENEEYGYRCLINSVYRVLDKLEVENRTFAKITPRNRMEKKQFNAVALREAFVNAVVHNDYSLGWPLVEFYSDRVVITSTGGLVEGLAEEDFFRGRTMLRNRELMRVFKDVELVEMLGSGMERILDAYDRSAFEITSSFIIATFPYAVDFDRSVHEENERSLKEVLKEVLKENEIQKVGPIIDFLQTNGAISPKEAQQVAGKSETTVWRYLDMLVERGIIEPSGSTNNRQYCLKKQVIEQMK